MKLIIFDLGNTLIQYEDLSLNWSDHYIRALESGLNRQGISSTPIQMKQALSILSFYNTRENIRTFEVEEGEVLNKVAKVFSAEEKAMGEDFFGYFQRKTRTEKTAQKSLAELQKRGIKTAVLTDVPYGMPKSFVLDDLKDLRKHLDLILTSCETGFRKPETRGIELIQSHFGTGKEDTCYVGDEQKDILCAQKARITSILISPNPSDWGQTHSISRIEEILNLLS
ncbi:MAG: HAD-IA family hydrolase [Spirochaetales bacterium]|nr:HAD-IA family hydrolase [Spirochaetales bacterium]